MGFTIREIETECKFSSALTVDALSQEQRDRLHKRLLSELRARDVTALRTDVVFGTARRPG